MPGRNNQPRTAPIPTPCVYTPTAAEMGEETMQNAGLHVVKHIYAQTGKGQYVKYSHMKLIR